MNAGNGSGDERPLLLAARFTIHIVMVLAILQLAFACPSPADTNPAFVQQSAAQVVGDTAKPISDLSATNTCHCFAHCGNHHLAEIKIYDQNIIGQNATRLINYVNVLTIRDGLAVSPPVPPPLH